MTNLTTYGVLEAITTTGYDGQGRAVSQTDAIGNTVETTYDSLGQTLTLSGATYPVYYAYDTAGHQYACNHDALGRVTNAYDSLSVVSTFRYNTRSEVINAVVGTNTTAYLYNSIGDRKSANSNHKSLYQGKDLSAFSSAERARLAAFGRQRLGVSALRLNNRNKTQVVWVSSLKESIAVEGSRLQSR